MGRGGAEKRTWDVEEKRIWEEEEQRLWDEEENKKLWLASAQEKRWLVELAAQCQLEWMVEEKNGESSKSGGNQKDEDGLC